MHYGKRHLPVNAAPSGPSASGGPGANEIAVYPGQMPPPDAAYVVGSYHIPDVGLVEIWARRAATFPWEYDQDIPP